MIIIKTVNGLSTSSVVGDHRMKARVVAMMIAALPFRALRVVLPLAPTAFSGDEREQGAE